MNQHICKNLDELKSIAKLLIDSNPNQRLFAIRGQMGAGKTTFIKEVCSYLGCTEPVTSPTFAIVNEYTGSIGPIYHFDFYRLKNGAEAINIGFDDYIYNGNYCFMEWPEIIKECIPSNTLNISIAVDESTEIRIFTF